MCLTSLVPIAVDVSAKVINFLLITTLEQRCVEFEPLLMYLQR